MDIAADRPIKFIPMKPEEQKKVAEVDYRIRWLIQIPAKTYSFQNEDYPHGHGPSETSLFAPVFQKS